MKTVITNLANEIIKPAPIKPIEFNLYLNKASATILEAGSSPFHFSNIKLIAKNYTKEFDLMFAWTDKESDGFLYLGKFNDGVVK